MPFTFQPLAIPDVILITPQVFADARGLFLEVYKESEYQRHGIADRFVQDSFSRSIRGTLRGLHFQIPPHAPAKLVRVTAGEVFDVAVDLRRSSASFGQAIGQRLTAESKQILFIPSGFAHGFCALTDIVEMQYKASAEYRPTHQRGVRWDDPTLHISWPVTEPVLSDQDRQLPLLDRAEIPFT